MSDDLTAATSASATASSLNQRSGNITAALYSICTLAEVNVSQGRLHQGFETYEQALQVSTARQERGAATPLAVGLVYAGLAQIHREWNDLDMAAEYALKAIELGEFGGHLDPYCDRG